jgi:hypothetical protein
MEQILLTYRGRAVTRADVAFIQELIARHAGASRWRLSKLLCEAWGWVQPNGQLCDMVCRSLMLELHRAGLIELPPVRFRARNNVVNGRRPEPMPVDRTPLDATLREIRPLEFLQVRRSGDEEKLFAYLLEAHHYLAYTRPVGEHLKYVVMGCGRPIACLAWSSAPRHLGPRDRFIGWSKEARRRNIRFLAYNTRFLILPWVRVPYLASHVLGRMAGVLPRDWSEVYKHPVYYLETFVDPGRFRGTCYLAANWRVLGLTTGRGKDDQTKRPNRPLKQVLGYPLRRDFRELLGRLS